MKKEEVVNRVVHDTIESNFVYPLDLKNCYYIAKLDKDWVIQLLQMRIDRKIKRINNKYVVKVKSNTAEDLLIYNHDGEYWLIELK